MTRTLVVMFGALLLSAGVPTLASAQDRLGGEIGINEARAGHQNVPVVGQDGAGRYLVVWLRNIGGDRDLFARRLDSDGSTMGVEFRVDDDSGDQTDPRLAMNAAGDYAIGFNLNGAEIAPYVRFFSADDTPLGPPVRVGPDWPGHQRIQGMDMHSDGRVLVAFHDESGQDGEGAGIFGQLYHADGSTDGAPFQLSESGATSQWNVEVDFASDGGFATVFDTWPGGPAGCSSVYLRTFDATGNPLMGDRLVQDDCDYDGWLGRIGRNASDDFVVTFTAVNTNWEDDIRARLFDADGDPLGDLFTVNSTRLQDQERSSALLLDDGSMVIAFIDRDGNSGGGTDGAFARAFQPDGTPWCGDYTVVEAPDGEWNHVDMIAGGVDSHLVVYQSDDGEDGGIFGQLFGAAVPTEAAMGCFAANCAKVQLADGAGTGKITLSGSLWLHRCPADDQIDGPAFPALESSSPVEIMIDGTVVLSTTLGAFSQGKGNSWKLRGDAGSTQLNFDRGSWKHVDRRSSLGPADASPADGLDVQLRIGAHVGQETISVDFDPARGLAQGCRKGQNAIACP